MEKIKYSCSKCDESTYNKQCPKCYKFFGYSDRMSDSSLSLEPAIKILKKNNK